MIFLGREIAAAKLMSAGLAFLQLLPRLTLVKKPFAMLRHYIRRDSPAFIDLRNGGRVLLSSHPHDLVTFFVVFLRRDYGRIQKGSVVIDVGANIGVFSLYAASCGARKVYAFEPSAEAYRVLCENIHVNKLTDVVIPINRAMSGADGATVRFSRSSSPYNKIGQGDVAAGADTCEIQTTTLGSFLRSQVEEEVVDVLKLDCEGAEFDILPPMDRATAERIHAIRMEVHADPAGLIVELKRKGYFVDKRAGHTVWLTRQGV